MMIFRVALRASGSALKCSQTLKIQRIFMERKEEVGREKNSNSGLQTYIIQ